MAKFTDQPGHISTVLLLYYLILLLVFINNATPSVWLGALEIMHNQSPNNAVFGI